MAKKKIPDHRIENEAAEAANLTMAGALLSEDESDMLCGYSEEPGSDMPDLWPRIRAANRQEKRHYNYRPRRLRLPAVAILLMLALVFGGFTGVKLYEMYRKDYEKHVEFKTLESVDESQLAFGVFKLPEGFAIQSVNDIADGKEVCYGNPEGNILIFNYVSTDLNMSIDNETEQETVTLNQGNIGYLFEKGDFIQIFWRHGDSFLSVRGDLDKAQMIDIAKNIFEK